MQRYDRRTITEEPLTVPPRKCGEVVDAEKYQREHNVSVRREK
jgi:hypothetical protein